MYSKPSIKNLIIVLYFLIVFSIAFLAYLKPMYNWDLIPYTASVVSLEQDNPQMVHSETYRIIKESVPNDTFNGLTSSNNYVKNMYTDFISFNQQLPFYKVKPLYIYLVYVLHVLGLGIVKATNLISIFSFIGICTVLFLFTNKLKTGSIGIILLSLLIFSKPFYAIAKLSTPDALSAFTITLSLYLFINKKFKFLACILLILSIFIRTDNIIICNILLIYFGLFCPKQYRIINYQAFGYILFATISYFMINHLGHSYGWTVLFSHSFKHLLDRPAEFIGHISAIDYLHILTSHGVGIIFSTNILYFIIIGLIGLMITTDSVIDIFYIHLVIIMMIIMIVYFLLFPSLEVDRYFITEYIIIVLGSLSIISSRYIPNNKLILSIFRDVRG